LTPNKSNKRGDRRARQNKLSGRATDLLIISSHKATGSTTNVVTSDVMLRRQNFNIVQTPPRQLSNQIFWAQLSTDDMISLSSIAVTESNVAFTPSTFNGFTGLAGVFDQYCLYAVSITFATLTVESSFPAIQCYTAIDYDSTTNIGKNALEAFSSFNYTSLGPGGQDSLVRFVKPCIAPQVTSSNLPVPGGIGRAWFDSAYPSVSHYGLRNIFDVYTASVTNAVHRVYTGVFGFRNNI